MSEPLTNETDILLQSERLVLRPFKASDAALVAELAGDYDVAKMCGRVPHPYPTLAAEGWIAMHAAGRANGQEHPLAITLKTGDLIGSVGLTRHTFDGQVMHELGYWLGKPYWGQGFAQEAAARIMAWGRDALGAQVFTSGHFVDNPASGAVLTRLGFVGVGQDELFGLARARKDTCERYVWPAAAASARLIQARPH